MLTIFAVSFFSFVSTARLSPGCGQPAPAGLKKGILDEWWVKVTDKLNPTKRRSFMIYVPRNYTQNPGNIHGVPLIFDFHGYYGSGKLLPGFDKMTINAEKNGYIVVFPNGAGNDGGDGHDPDKATKPTPYSGDDPYPRYGYNLPASDDSKFPSTTRGWHSSGTGGEAGRYSSVCNKQGKTGGDGLYDCYTSCAINGNWWSQGNHSRPLGACPEDQYECKNNVCKGGKNRQADDCCSSSTCYDDVEFIEVVLSSLFNSLCIDTARVHGVAMSTGAVFLYYLATQTIGTWFASIMPVEGSFPLGHLQPPVAAIPLIEIHGVHDCTIPANVTNYCYSGCPKKIKQEAAKDGIACTYSVDYYYYTGTKSVLDTWATVAKCSGNKSEPLTYPAEFNYNVGGVNCFLPYGRDCDSAIVQCVHPYDHTWPFCATPNKKGKACKCPKKNPGCGPTEKFGDLVWWFSSQFKNPRAEELVNKLPALQETKCSDYKDDSNCYLSDRFIPPLKCVWDFATNECIPDTPCSERSAGRCSCTLTSCRNGTTWDCNNLTCYWDFISDSCRESKVCTAQDTNSTCSTNGCRWSWDCNECLEPCMCGHKWQCDFPLVTPDNCGNANKKILEYRPSFF